MNFGSASGVAWGATSCLRRGEQTYAPNCSHSFLHGKLCRISRNSVESKVGNPIVYFSRCDSLSLSIWLSHSVTLSLSPSLPLSLSPSLPLCPACLPACSRSFSLPLSLYLSLSLCLALSCLLACLLACMLAKRCEHMQACCSLFSIARMCACMCTCTLARNFRRLA